MGKAAENERVKLRATFVNNLGVAAVAGGGLAPMLGIMLRDNSSVRDLVAGVVVFVCMVGLGRWLQSNANSILEEFQDE